MSYRRTIANRILLDETCYLLKKGKTVKIRAKGDSMRPVIHGDSDTLIISPCTEMQKGDIVLAKIKGTGYVVHRIIRIDSQNIYLAGDNNLFGEEKCNPKDVFGIVKTVIRGGKERSLISGRAKFAAKYRRLILPLRRLRWKISHRMKILRSIKTNKQA